MGTPFISLLEPSRLDAYDGALPPAAQPAPAGSFPPVFADAMAVRESVFVREQGVPLAHEHDADDARSCHWVAYASVAGSGSGSGSEARTVPIGTLRLVPFPHPPHPAAGARYVDNRLVPPEGEGEEVDEEEKEEEKEKEAPGPSPQAPPPFGLRDRATTYHDGREPYVKIGRVAVVSEFRGLNIATQLWAAARRWLEEHPEYFDPSVSELGMDRLGVPGAPGGGVPKWNGLVCCHGQESALRLYEQWGFRVDEGMGRWFEEGIPHVGMFLRLRTNGADPKV